ncbi:hypothetical protein Dimus_004173 [Dionaea muscipula]
MMRGGMMMKNQEIQQNQNQNQNQQLHQQTVVVMEENMSNLTSASGEASTVSSSNNRAETGTIYPHHQQYFSQQNHEAAPPKKKRNLPGNPDPDAEVIALSPKTLLATNRFVCEICNKGFQRDQNLQLHRRGHNLPWKLKQRTNKEVVRKKVYVCPELSCVHHDPSRALGDLTGIKKHFCRKHGEKKWKCDKCSKRYAVQSDWKAHSKTCGTREYRCDCGTLFSRRDSFITHRAFCDVLTEETARSMTVNHPLHHLPAQAAAAAAAAAGTSSSHLMMNLQSRDHQFNIPPSIHNSFPLKRESTTTTTTATIHPHHHHHHHQQPHHLLQQQQQPHNFNTMMRTDLPSWLACPPPPPAGHQPIIDLSTVPAPPPPPSPPPPMFNTTATRLDQEFPQTPHGHQSSNPSPTSLGPSTQLPALYPSSSHMSATALLQKAAQMGATMSKGCSSTPQTTTTTHQAHVPSSTVGSGGNIITTMAMAAAAAAATAAGFGLNLSSRDQEMTSEFVMNHHHHGLTSFGTNKAAAITDGTAAASVTPLHLSSCSSSSSLLHDMMNSLSSATGFHSPPPAYDDDTFGSMMDHKKDGTVFYHQAVLSKAEPRFGGGEVGNGGGGGRAGGGGSRGGGNDGLTRDFLGLRPLSHNEILNMAGLGGCMNTNVNVTHGRQDHESHKSWQG